MTKSSGPCHTCSRCDSRRFSANWRSSCRRYPSSVGETGFVSASARSSVFQPTRTCQAQPHRRTSSQSTSNKGLDSLTRICFKDLLSLLARGAIGPETIYKQRRQADPKEKLTEVTIGCGSLRKNRNLGPNRCSCQSGAHWSFTSCAGKWGGDPIPPAKDTRQTPDTRISTGSTGLTHNKLTLNNSPP